LNVSANVKFRGGGQMPQMSPRLRACVAATDMKAIRKKQTTLQAVVYLGFTARGDKLSLGSPSPLVAA